ncbi:MAG TPA: hypothetical protein VD905_21900, partial [Flavobacteriales bacterium]|nr:hypothetical protein [Flavobacteriales bacterium]
RLIDTRIGRWFTPDPIINPGESPYASFANNPIYFTDPSGLYPGGVEEGAADAAANTPKKGLIGRIFGKIFSKKNSKVKEEDESAIGDGIKLAEVTITAPKSGVKKQPSKREQYAKMLKQIGMDPDAPGLFERIGNWLGRKGREWDRWAESIKGSRQEWTFGVQLNTKDLKMGGSTSDLPFVKPKNWDNVLDVDWDDVKDLAEMVDYLDKVEMASQWGRNYLQYRKILFRLNTGKFRNKSMSTLQVLKMQKTLFWRKVAGPVLKDITEDHIKEDVSKGISRGYFHGEDEPDSVVTKGIAYPSGNILINKQHPDSAAANRSPNKFNSRYYEIPNSAGK